MIFIQPRSAASGYRVRKVERGKSHLEIAAALGAEILSGTRLPGSRLPSTAEMYQAFGVSRLVVREVVRTLAAKGMVTSKARVGTTVLSSVHWNWLDPQILEWRGKVALDSNFMAQLTQIRLALEPAAASLAAEHRTERDIAAMQLALQEMYQSGDNHQIFSKADQRFHDAVIAATHNPFFHASSSATRVVLSRFLGGNSPGLAAREAMHVRAAAQHERILDAILAKKPSAAAHAMARVIKDGARHYPEEL